MTAAYTFQYDAFSSIIGFLLIHHSLPRPKSEGFGIGHPRPPPLPQTTAVSSMKTSHFRSLANLSNLTVDHLCARLTCMVMCSVTDAFLGYLSPLSH